MRASRMQAARTCNTDLSSASESMARCLLFLSAATTWSTLARPVSMPRNVSSVRLGRHSRCTDSLDTCARTHSRQPHPPCSLIGHRRAELLLPRTQRTRQREAAEKQKERGEE